jgi:integrase
VVFDVEIVGDDERDLTKSRENDKQREQRKYIDNDTIQERISQIENKRDKMFILTTYMTGLRVTEVINIRRKDIDFDNGEIIARWQKNKKWKNRTVPMHEKLAMPLSFYVDTFGYDEKVFDFTRQTGYNICKRHLGEGPHALRHSFAVHYLRNTDDSIGIVKLSRQLGHSNVRTTMEYLKIAPEDLKSALDQVDF